MKPIDAIESTCYFCRKVILPQEGYCCEFSPEFTTDIRCSFKDWVHCPYSVSKKEIIKRKLDPEYYSLQE